MLTGIGMVTPLGNDARGDFGGIIAGRSGAAGLVTIYPCATLPVTLRLRGQGVRSRRSAWTASSRGAPTATAVRAGGRGREAIEDAGLDVTARRPGERTGTAVATGIGGLQTLDVAHEHLFARASIA